MAADKGISVAHINDLAKASKKLAFFLFAGDTNIYYESSSILDIQKTVHKELRKVHKWLEANWLALNNDKTNFVIFHSPQNMSNDQVTVKFGRKPGNMCEISWSVTWLNTEFKTTYKRAFEKIVKNCWAV